MRLVNQGLKSLLSAALPPHRFLVHGPREVEAPGDSGGAAASDGALELALTFDDGPDPEWTPRVLDCLLEAGIRATFFVVGEQARQHPELIRRMVRDGHDVGNHTETHSDPDHTPTRMFLDEVRRTRSMLQELTGEDCRLVRPPKGRLTIGKLWGLLREELSVVLWNVDPRDFAMTSPDEIRDWSQSYRPRSGDVVLLHDNRPFAATGVRELLRRMPENGVRFVGIRDWIEGPPASRRSTAPSANAN